MNAQGKGQKEPASVVFNDSGIGLIESHHEEGFAMDWRLDSYAKIFLVVSGEGVLELRRRDIAVRAPMICVVPRGEEHRLVDAPRQPLSLYGLCLREPTFPGPGLVAEVCSDLSTYDDRRVTQRVAAMMRGYLAEERLGGRAAREAQLCLVGQILVELSRAPSRDHFHPVSSARRVEAYVQALEKEFWKDERVDTVAASLGLSRRRFTQLFREVTGNSWLAEVTGLRMRHAAKLLEETTLSVRAVAFECGYADLSHFYRVFKQHFGTSPGAKRRELDHFRI